VEQMDFKSGVKGRGSDRWLLKGLQTQTVAPYQWFIVQ